MEIKKHHIAVMLYALTEIRTPVLALKGPRPSPLDDEGERMKFYQKPRGRSSAILKLVAGDWGLGIGGDFVSTFKANLARLEWRWRCRWRATQLVQ